MRSLRLLNSKWYTPLKVIFILVALTAFAVILAMSWNDYIDHSASELNAYENITNKLYWYVFISQVGTWLPFTMMFIAMLAIALMFLFTPPKSSFKSINAAYDNLHDTNQINAQHLSLAKEVNEILERDAKDAIKEGRLQENSVESLSATIKKHWVNLITKTGRALSKENKEQLQKLINETIEQKSQEFFIKLEKENQQEELKQKELRKQELMKKLADIERKEKGYQPDQVIPKLENKEIKSVSYTSQTAGIWGRQ